MEVALLPRSSGFACCCGVPLRIALDPTLSKQRRCVVSFVYPLCTAGILVVGLICSPKYLWRSGLVVAQLLVDHLLRPSGLRSSKTASSRRRARPSTKSRSEELETGSHTEIWV